MPGLQAEAGQVPKLTALIEQLKEQVKYYSDLNMQLGGLSHRVLDTQQPPPESAKGPSPSRPDGILTQLENISEFIAIENGQLQDSVNKLTKLL